MHMTVWRIECKITSKYTIKMYCVTETAVNESSTCTSNKFESNHKKTNILKTEMQNWNEKEFYALFKTTKYAVFGKIIVVHPLLGKKEYGFMTEKHLQSANISTNKQANKPHMYGCINLT